MLASRDIKPFFSGLSDYWHADCDLINIKFPFGMILYAITNMYSFISGMVVLMVFNQIPTYGNNYYARSCLDSKLV